MAYNSEHLGRHHFEYQDAIAKFVKYMKAKSALLKTFQSVLLVSYFGNVEHHKIFFTI